jgi:hypothetical protein
VFKTVVPIHSALAKDTLSDILKQCGLQIEDLLDLLQAASMRPILDPAV